MKSFVVQLFLAAICVGPVLAADMPEMPKPSAEHKWLDRFLGEWKVKTEMYPPGQATMHTEGTETVRSLGGFWIVGEVASSIMGTPYNSVMTLGYDPESKKYVGSWVDSMMPYQWKYVGTLDESGKTLTLLTEGPCPMRPGQMTKFKEVVEFKSPTHRVFTSYMQGDDGKWVKGMQAEYTKVK